ncbi:flagellin [Rhizobium sp. LC145]|uniref:flagellin N-terminal helical domain-containing protein n=1 Tax=Rhizobium sp. LC145 TaxID=1120688 RepID=UPI00062A0A7F|nr:flagellin [Rhizobium sp. LC145]KKX23680.1 flagellar hook associated protein [Rhizobium sp. LC145]TKT58976.1 flagellar hook associated protein [Rhizobiaceae bacterium LC148]
MTSILTNTAAMAALQTLRAIDSKMEETQARVSSGLRVGTAADNAAYWSIATTMRSDNGALSSVQDALGLGAAKVDTAYAAMESAVDVVTEIKNKLVASREAGVDKAKIQEEIVQLQDQLRSIAESASFSGENWLQAAISDGAGNLTDVIKQVVGSFTRDASGSVAVKTIDIPLNRSTVLFDTAGNAGILDQVAYYSDTGVTKAFEITTGAPPVTKVQVAKVFTEAQLRALPEQTAGTPVTFNADATTGLVTVANSTTAANTNGVYFKIGDDQYVKVTAATADNGGATAAQTAAQATGTSAIGRTADGVNVYLETGASGQLATPLTYSVSDLDITKHLTLNGLTESEGLDAMIQFVETQLQAITSATAGLGSVSMRIGLQEDFVSKLTDSIDSGIGRLVDADMNEESTRLKALQTQQQLAIQSLSIANTNSENILSLFRQ